VKKGTFNLNISNYVQVKCVATLNSMDQGFLLILNSPGQPEVLPDVSKRLGVLLVLLLRIYEAACSYPGSETGCPELSFFQSLQVNLKTHTQS
jgi:hypothetical protein